MLKGYVVVDLEMTGLHARTDRILEIGAVKIKEGKQENFHRMVNPRMEISKEVTELTGITNDMVKDGCEPEQAAAEFRDFAEGFPLVGHNLIFDYSGKLSSLLSGKGLSYDSLGMGTDYLSGSRQIGWEETGKQTAVRHTSAGHDAVEGHFRYARKIADFCRKRHLELVLVTTPAWHSYYENLDPIQAEMTDSLIGVLRDQYGLHYLDYMRDKRFTADDFYDADHLSSDVGARKFTDILIRDLSTLK